MKEYAPKPENQSRTLDSNPRASEQAPMHVILQRYKENIRQYAPKEDGVVQCLKLKPPPGVPIDINNLSLFRLLDYHRRPDPDPDVGGVIFEPGDKVALRARADVQYPIEYAEIHTLLGQQATADAAAGRNIGGGVNLQQILTNAQVRYGTGELAGFEEWIAGTHTNLNVENVLDKTNELRAAAGIAGNVNIDETPIAGTDQTADILHGNEQTEVKTIRMPIKSYQNFTGQVSAALGKFQHVNAGGANRYNVTIYASIDATLLATLLGAGTNVAIGQNTRNTSIDPNTLIKTTTIIRNSDASVLNVQYENQWTKFLETLNSGGWAGYDKAHRINIILENGAGRVFNRNANAANWV